MAYYKKTGVVKIDPTVTHLQPDQFDNDEPIQSYPFGPSAMRVTTATGFPEASGDVITSRTTDDTGSQIFIGEKAYIRTFEASAWSSWRELGESGGGGPVEWDDILNKPSQFPPSPHTHDIEDIIGLQAALDDKASAQSVNELQQEVDEHKADDTIHKTSDVIRTETETKLKVEVVSSSESESPEQGRIVFDVSQGKFLGGNGSEWV